MVKALYFQMNIESEASYWEKSQTLYTFLIPCIISFTGLCFTTLTSIPADNTKLKSILSFDLLAFWSCILKSLPEVKLKHIKINSNLVIFDCYKPVTNLKWFFVKIRYPFNHQKINKSSMKNLYLSGFSGIN